VIRFIIFCILFNTAITGLAVKYLFLSSEILKFSLKAKFGILLILTVFPIQMYYFIGIWAELAYFFVVLFFMYFWTKIVLAKSDSIFDFVKLAFSVILLTGVRPK